jgi:hypothetical protein
MFSFVFLLLMLVFFWGTLISPIRINSKRRVFVTGIRGVGTGINKKAPDHRR